MIRKSAVNLFHNSHDGERSARRGAMKNAALYLIDGEYVDAPALSAKMGLPKPKALAKLRRVRERRANNGTTGPLTWAELGVQS